jgi:transposase
VDAAAVAVVASHELEATSVHPETVRDVLGLLDERRDNLARQRVRVVNHLHALLMDLLPGGLGKQMTTARAEHLLGTVVVVDDVSAARVELARELIEDLHALDRHLAVNQRRIAAKVAKTPTTLTRITGVGPVSAGRLLGRVADPCRFPTGGNFASYAGAAPVEVSSGDTRRHLLPRAGDRQLKAALHMIAIVPIRITDSDRHAYFHRKLIEGKTKKDALRCLKRRLAEVVRKNMIRGQAQGQTPHRHGLTERPPRIMYDRGNKSCGDR